MISAESLVTWVARALNAVFAFEINNPSTNAETVATTAIEVGVPYTDDMVANAAADAAGQANPDSPQAEGVTKRYGKATSVRAFDGRPGQLTEMDAMVAYLQVLGRLTDAATRPVAQAE